MYVAKTCIEGLIGGRFNKRKKEREKKLFIYDFTCRKKNVLFFINKEFLL